MAIVIDVNLKSRSPSAPIQKLLDRLTAVDKALDSVNTKLIHMNTLLGRGAQLASAVKAPRMPSGSRSSGGGAGSRVAGGGGSASGGAASPMDLFKFWHRMNQASGGQFGSQKAASLHLAAMSAQGQIRQGKGAGYRNMAQLAPHLFPKAPQGIGGKVWQAIMTTRVGVGAGGLQVAPLVGRVLAAMGPLGLALGVAGTAVMAFAHQAMEAYERLSKAATDSAILGQGASTAQRMAGQLGLGDARSLGQALQGAIQSGAGAGYAVQAGINPVGGPFGDNNYGAKVVKALEFIANAGSFDEARRRSEALGMPDAARAYYLSPGQRGRLGAGIGDSEASKGASVRAGFEVAQYIQSAMKILNAAFSPTIEAFGKLFEVGNKFGVVLEKAGFGAERLGLIMSSVVAPAMRIFEALLESLAQFLDWLDSKLGGKQAESKEKTQIKAIDENTRALDANTRVHMGGGQRSRAAVPSGLRGNQIDNADVMNGLRSGTPMM